MKDSVTTIKVKRRTVEIINSMKVHPRQSCEEIILQLIRESKNEKE